MLLASRNGRPRVNPSMVNDLTLAARFLNFLWPLWDVMHKELIDNIPCIPDFSEVLYYKLFIKKIISKIPINLKGLSQTVLVPPCPVYGLPENQKVNK